MSTGLAHPAESPHAGNHRRGFALVITLGLLALLMLILLALGAWTKVEVTMAENARSQAQARHNALLALNLAIGRVQKFAGPDSRVTATAETFGGGRGASHYTGVWDATQPDPTPLTWLVSGNEGVNALAITPSVTSSGIELVGASSAGTAGDVTAPLQPILAYGLRGQSGAAVVGHYAWWVGDEGVKADVTLADRTDELSYAPFDSAESRQRLHQQMTLGAAPVDATGAAIFEPRDTTNAPRVAKLIADTQMAFLRRPDGLTPLGSDLPRQYFHDWSAGNCAVLAQTQPGGLRRDLSRQPGLLGPAFASWADYGVYMEDTASPGTPAISPDYPALAPRESLRRRYRMTAPLTAAGITHGATPVLSYFLITFNVRTDPSVGGPMRPLEVRGRWMVSLWNPYTSALVPEDLSLEVTGLPATDVVNDTLGGTVATLALDSLYGAPLRISLPWIPGGRSDQQSWLPGRVYTWCALENLNKAAAPPASGFASVFYTRNLSTAAGQGVQRAVPFATISSSALAHLQGAQSQLTLRLYRNLAGGGRELLRTYLSPTYASFVTTPTVASAATYQFSWVFHLAESIDLPASPADWLKTPGQDPREAVLPAGSFLPGANGPRPELYPNYTAISFPDRLLDRALPASTGSATGQSYNEDAPLFELPRGPLLSIGGLQQLHTTGMQPFAIGNSWGQAGRWNRLFDQYFFSGLAPGVGTPNLAAGEPLPNALLRIVGRNPGGAALTASELMDLALGGYTSKYLLQGGAFNLNSVNPLAWQAVLRGGRQIVGQNFTYLAALAASGTSADAPLHSVALGESVFFRFSSSAQETYQADAGYAASTTVPPAAPNVASLANTHLFRRGVRALTPEQTLVLARAVVSLLRIKFASSGPYRSLEEFLDASVLFGGMSLLEKALADAETGDGKHLNDPSLVAEFSSQWLTQGDLLSLLAPVLFPRSDTFRIRAYGDAVNPVTGAVDGRAWCEAMMQRQPEYFDPFQPAETAPDALNLFNQTYGRRFRVVHFRWLSPAEI